ncbi:hypothetical protein [Nakamurella deserti]|uniref:hypothetical protein n=1 Tax=Nakamurella deserti TaxID=2164074 RepID=UPI0013009377|nr:hypothetical protein [Nakamurella deserti]
MTGPVRPDAEDRWAAPAAARPVRGRVWLPAEVSPDFPAALAAAFFAAAAVVTGGTVLIRSRPAVDDPLAAAARTVFDRAGGYVVRSADGLTVTTRSTSGELTPFEADLSAAPLLVPLAAVVTAVAGGRSVLRGVGGPRVARTRDALRSVGASCDLDGTDLTVRAEALRPGRWDGRGDPPTAAAGLVLALVVPGVEVAGVRELGEVLPGVEQEWLRLLSSEEYLIPGSARLPHDYL